MHGRGAVTGDRAGRYGPTIDSPGAEGFLPLAKARTRRDILKQAALAGGGLAIAGIAPAAAAETTPKRGGTLKIVHQKVINLNPAIQAGIATMIPGAQIFAGLLEYDAQWQPHPYLATAWEAAKDGLSYTFHLHKDALFHDGKPVTSADVAFSLATVKQYHPFGVAMFGGVDRVDTPDPHTAIIKLKHPVPSLLVSTSSVLLPIIPQHVYGNGPIRTNPANLRPVGSGPFKFKSYNSAEYLIVERNPHYFRAGRPYLDELLFDFVNGATTPMIAMMRGSLHYFPYASQLNSIAAMAKQPHLAVTQRGYEAIGPLNWLAFNVREKPLSDLRVRQAIAYAINKDFILQKLFLGQAKDATGPIAPSGPFYDKGVARYRYDPDTANKLLDAAGYPRKAGGSRFPLTIDWNPAGGNPQALLVAQYLKSELPKVGIDAELRASPDFPTWARRIANWDFQATMDQVFNYPDPVIGVARTYLSTNIKRGVIWSNTQGYSNPQVDRLFHQAGMENNTKKRYALYAQVQKLLVEQLPVYWIDEIPFSTVYHRGLADTPQTIWGAMGPFDKVYWRTPPA